MSGRLRRWGARSVTVGALLGLVLVLAMCGRFVLYAVPFALLFAGVALLFWFTRRR